MSGKAKTVSSAPRLRLCVTGGIACGKSLVGGFLKKLGVAVIEADEVCHDLMRAGTPLFPRIVAAFGRGIVAPDGGIDRAVLGRRVFGDPAELGRLNAVLHPAAKDAIETWLRARSGRGGAAAVIPLLYEAAWEKSWDCVVCVGAPRALQWERLRSRGLTESECRARLAAQWPVEEKMKRADHVIFNAGTLLCAQNQTVRVMQYIGLKREDKDGR